MSSNQARMIDARDRIICRLTTRVADLTDTLAAANEKAENAEALLSQIESRTTPEFAAKVHALLSARREGTP